MRNGLARRILHSAVAFVGLVVAVFFLSRMTGDPAGLYLPINASQELRDQFSEQNGLNDPVWVQFGDFLSGVLHLDFGESLLNGRPAMELVSQALPWTLGLAALSMLAAVLLAVPIGAYAARRPGSAVDRLASNLTLLTASIPDFWLALVAILVFAVQLGWLPVAGLEGPEYWVLPVLVLVARPLGVLVQVTREALMHELSATYVRAARTKGVDENRIVYVHSLRNAVAPIVTVIGDQAAAILNGAVVVETIFGFPGVGRLMIDSILRRDFAVILAGVVTTAALIFVMNILIDLIYSWANPRLRHESKAAAR
jgi:peptide/nickel transport system permease protein